MKIEALVMTKSNPIAGMRDWDFRPVGQRTAEDALGDPVVRRVGVVDAVPTDENGRVFARTSEHFAPVYACLLPTPHMLFLPFISTAHLPCSLKSCQEN